jgi:hypothetical protein
VPALEADLDRAAEFGRAEKAASICAGIAGATLIARRCRFYPTPRTVKMYLSGRDAAAAQG